MICSRLYKKEWDKVNKMAASGLVVKAVKYAEKLYKKSKTPEANVFFCEVLVILNQQEKALAEYKKGLLRYSDVALFVFSYTRFMLLRGDVLAVRAALSNTEKLNNLAPDMCLGLCDVCVQAGIKDKAIDLCERCLSDYPEHADLHFRVAGFYLDKSDFARSYTHYYASYEKRPEHFPSVFNIALVEHRAGHYDVAIEYYKKSIELDPAHIDSYKNICASLLLVGKQEESLRYARTSVEYRPEIVDTWLILSGVYKEMMMIDQATDAYSKAMEIDEGSDTAHFYKYELLLLQERFVDGWEAYEWRFNQQEVVPRHFGFARWEGQSPDDKSVLIYAEQGVGDEVMFSSCIPDMLESGIRVVVDCDPRLGDIFGRSFPGVTVHAARKEELPDWVSQHPDIGYECPIGSLPRYLRKSADDFPVRSSYLLADPSRVDQWARKLNQYLAGLKVGISWMAGRNADARTKRSVPLEQWVDLFGIHGCHFFNVQYGDHKIELDAVMQMHAVQIVDFEDIDPMLDLDGLAAMLVNLDLVITVDNSTAHLAAALGVPVWVLLPFSPDWRWGVEGVNSLWYRDIRLFRQKRLNDWDGVLSDLGQALAEFSCKKHRQ